MNKKRLLSVLLSAAMVAGTMAVTVPVYADDTEEITWMFWDDLEATEDLVSKGYKDVIDRFNTEYEGKYHVTPITTNLEEYDGKLNALIAAGQTPDVYICNPGPNMDVYVNAGAAADLTDILENQEKDWYATFTDGIFDRLTYDGKIMAVPTNFAAACVYYNTELFEKAGVEVPTTYDELIDIFREDKFTRLPVYKDSQNNIVGIINMKDLLLYDKNEEFVIDHFLRKPHFTYETKSISDLLVEMKDSTFNIAIVLDEYGDMAGLITLEDILEEIVGEIHDEYDEKEDELVQKISDREYIIEGSMHLDDVNDHLDTELDSEDYDSLGGFIIEHLDRLPVAGDEVITEDGIRLIVEKLDKNRIEKVHVYLPEKDPETLDNTES